HDQFGFRVLRAVAFKAMLSEDRVHSRVIVRWRRLGRDRVRGKDQQADQQRNKPTQGLEPNSVPVATSRLDDSKTVWSAELPFGLRATRQTENAVPNWSSALRFMESPLSFFRMHWGHEPRRCGAPASGTAPGVIGTENRPCRRPA